MKLLFKILLVLLSVALLILLGFGVYYFAVTASARLDGTTLNLAQNALSLYDNDGNLLVECSLRGENGVKTANLQAHTIDAFVCAEDREFFTHKGLNYKRMAKAAWRNLTT
ncbi:MAG: transglycosylase domain-containing protein, partial [Clostridia bacterium]|nr:transglycosylase domain-containing protein [Clostridia bacterium]